VAHTHDLVTQALTDTSKKDALVREALGDEVSYLGYVRSGVPMAKALAAVRDLDRVRGLVLGKRGLVAWGRTPKECYDSLFRLVTRMEDYLRRARGGKNPLARARYEAAAPEGTARQVLPPLRGLLSRHRRVVLHLDESGEALRFAGSELAKNVHRRGMANPENILRCGRQPLYVDEDLGPLDAAAREAALRKAVDLFEADYRASFAKHGKGGEMLGPSPRVVLLPGIGIVSAGPDKKSAEIAGFNYRQVIRVIEAAEAVDQFRFLDEASAFEFEYWRLEIALHKHAEPELARRVALVTGAAGGIGRAIAERFAREGAHVVLTDLDDEAADGAADAICRALGDPHRAIGVRADSSSEEETARAFDRAVLAFGGVDVLVANAGFVRPGPVDETSLETWERTVGTNVTGYFLAVREAVRIMKSQGFGTIVLNASKAAFAPAKENAAYAASKAAVAHFARNLAVELAPAGIRANCFNADFVDTPMIRRMIADRAALKGISPEQQLEEYRKRNLLKTGPIPVEAVAEAALFLASDRSRYTTGSVITVDGGLQDAMPR
jgi:NAD(P)-dependent dehydrogenase (short-subunit alcohol dehydrogenase family)/rhamnose utilization protein RhaD (predicted bifunctional aldolase and dehydrogenase)